MLSLPRTRLFGRLDPAIPLLIIEGGAGTHKHALLNEWAAREGSELRVVVDFDPNQPSVESMNGQLAYRLELAGVPVAERAGTGLAATLERAVAALDRPVALGVPRLDELPLEAARVLVELPSVLPRFRLLATAVDAYDLVGMAVAAGVGYEVVEDTLLGYTADEVAELLARALPEAGEAGVRTILAATRGNPALVERTIELHAPEILAGTLTSEQAFWGWLPQRNGPEPFREALRMLAQAPRFSRPLLHCLFGDHRGDYLMERLRRQVGELITTGSGEAQFVWTPALRRQWRRWYAAQPVEQIDADRVRIAECARSTGDIELALLMLLASHRLDQAAQLAADWLWELLQAAPGPLAETLAALDPAVLASRPSLLALLSSLGGGHLELAADAGLERVQQALFEGVVAGSTPVQLGRLAMAAVVALRVGEPGFAARACVRWTTLASARSAEVSAALSPALASDALVVAETLFQLDRIDLAAQVAVEFLPQLRRRPGSVGGVEGAREAALTSLWAAASAMLGSGPAPGTTGVAGGSERPVELVGNAVRQTWEALDRGDLEVADAVTRVALSRLDRAAEWPVLVAHRMAVLLARGAQDQAAEEFTRHVSAEQWRAWQQHAEAPGWFAVLAGLVVSRAPGWVDAQWGLGLPESFRTLPPAALPRWCPGAREFVDLLLPPRGVEAALLAAHDSEPAGAAPRMVWNLGVLEAVVRLRVGEESTAVPALLAGGAELRRPSAPLVLALARREEIDTLRTRLPQGAPRVVRDSLELAAGYAGQWGEAEPGVRLAPREVEVLEGVRRGLTNSAIATELFVSVNTVKFHRTNLYRKLGANSRQELLAEALRLGY